MTNVTNPAQLMECTSPLVHMTLLARAPERVLALRLAMSSAIGSSSVVLDAGCGSLGVLAIMAARLGARRVIAADIGPLDSARVLAQANGVADRIEFLQCDVADLPASSGIFDVILGMIYDNEPRRDLEQQRLIASLAARFARPDTAIIPGTVRYTVAGYDSAGPDLTERTLRDSWDSAVGRAEAFTGITMEAIRPFPIAECSRVMEQLSQSPRHWVARLGGAGEPEMRLLTNRELFTEISYAEPASAATYPQALALTVTAPGRLDTTIWRQELKFGDLLIRSTTTIYPLTPPCDVRSGDTAVLSTDGGWGDAIPLAVSRKDRT